MNGSAKQVSRAEEIKAESLRIINDWLGRLPEKAREATAPLAEKILSGPDAQEASVWIDQVRQHLEDKYAAPRILVALTLYHVEDFEINGKVITTANAAGQVLNLAVRKGLI